MDEKKYTLDETLDAAIRISNLSALAGILMIKGRPMDNLTLKEIDEKIGLKNVNQIIDQYEQLPEEIREGFIKNLDPISYVGGFYPLLNSFGSKKII